MKMTLLELVQTICSDIDSDEINSIDDTIESTQVATIVRDTYFEIISNRNWPHLSKLFQCESVSDVDKPTHVRLPDGVQELTFLAYDKQTLADTRRRFEEIHYKQPEDFLFLVNKRDSSSANTESVVDDSGVILLILNDRAPSYWTSFDDEHIVFDSFDSDVDTTIQVSKLQCRGYIQPAWEHADDFTPDLPEEAFPRFLAEAKSTAFLVVKQMANEKEEQKARRQSTWLSRKAWRTKGGVRYPDYGRASRKGYRHPTFRDDV